MTDCAILSSPAHLRGKKEIFIKKLKIFRFNPKVWIPGAVKKYRQAEKFFEKISKIFCLNPKVLQNRAVKETGCGAKEKFFAFRRLFFEKYRW